MTTEACARVPLPFPVLDGRLTDPRARTVRYLRLSVTDRCNYRCTYCLPAGRLAWQTRAQLLSLEEMERVVSVMASLGVERVRVTGGEPLVRGGIVSLVSHLATLPGVREVAMTTNGHLLGRYARMLADAGLAGVNVSVDSLDPVRFEALTRGGELSTVLHGIETALRSGIPDVKINCVAMRGPHENELPALCEWAWARGVVPRFIELMPVGRLGQHARLGFLAGAEILDTLGARFGAFVAAESADEGIRGPAEYHTVVAGHHAGRRVGLIRAMSDPGFCGQCNRVRLTATGGLRPCLSSDAELSLRDALRRGVSDDDLRTLVRDALALKAPAHRLAEVDRAPLTMMGAVGG